MRTFGLSLALVFLGFSALWSQGKTETNPQANPLAGLKPWEVPFIPAPIQDTLGKVDTLFLDLKKGAKEGEWVLNFNVFNDESLFALSFPVRHDSLLAFDSISLAGTRIDFFQTKLVNKSPTVPNVVVVGLFSALSPDAPPMPPGNGLVMKMFFKAPASRPISIRSVATINMPPSLEFVTPRGTPVHPAVVRVGDSGPAAPAEKPAPVKPSKRKRRG